MKEIKKTSPKKLKTRVISGLLAAASCITMAAAPTMPAAGELFGGMAITAEAAVTYKVLYDTDGQNGKPESNRTLPVDQNVLSNNKKFCLRFQSDGNLVVYRYSNTNYGALWNSRTCGYKNSMCVLQADGNLVIYYTPANGNRRSVFHTGTNGNRRVQLCLADDGELFIRAKATGKKLWTSGTHVGTGTGKVEDMLTWAVNIANDNSHGYSQQNRLGPNYDCSSFVSSAAKNAGFNVRADLTTYIMKEHFVAAGFTWIPWSQIGSSANLKRGDILLKINDDYRACGHTELYLGNNRLVGAHCTKPNKADEISECGYWYDYWDGVLRYNG